VIKARSNQKPAENFCDSENFCLLLGFSPMALLFWSSL